jgi:hypothetical protein
MFGHPLLLQRDPTGWFMRSAGDSLDGGDLTAQQRAAGERALLGLRTQLENLEKALKSALGDDKPLSGDTDP